MYKYRYAYVRLNAKVQEVVNTTSSISGLDFLFGGLKLQYSSSSSSSQLDADIYSLSTNTYIDTSQLSDAEFIGLFDSKVITEEDNLSKSKISCSGSGNFVSSSKSGGVVKGKMFNTDGKNVGVELIVSDFTSVMVGINNSVQNLIVKGADNTVLTEVRSHDNNTTDDNCISYIRV